MIRALAIVLEPRGGESKISGRLLASRGLVIDARRAGIADHARLPASRGGVGVAYMRDYAVRQNLLDGSLREVLAAYAPPSRAELFSLYLPNRYLPPKVRVFIDYLVDCFDSP